MEDENHECVVNGETYGITLGVQEDVVYIDNLPKPEPNTYYIVPSLVGRVISRILGRDDLVIPATSSGDRPIRAENRRIMAVRKLIWMNPYDDE